MKISKDWLLDYVDISKHNFEEVCELITTRVAEIEGVHNVSTPVKYGVVVKVEEVKNFELENKKNLKFATVFDGNRKYTLACGAPNLEKDMLTVLIPPGGYVRKVSPIKTKINEKEELHEDQLADVIEDDLEQLVLVEIKSFGEQKSEGILVSEAELGISSNHDGIINLGLLGVVPGDKLDKLRLYEDQIIEIDNKSLTHRPDLWSHFGFAREISAVLGIPLKRDFDEVILTVQDLLNSRIDSSNKNIRKIEPVIKQNEGCRRISVLGISGVSDCPSPLWMKRRLFAVGAGIRGILVDSSNYVLHDIGQPNHAYDLSLIKGDNLIAKAANDSESFTGLDTVKRSLSKQDLVIADSESAVSLAGIIGGMNSSITNGTTDIVLESANFDPVLIRKGCKVHQLRTDSSVRFEKSLSPYQTPLALLRYSELLEEAGQKISINFYADTDNISTNKTSSFAHYPSKVDFSFSYIRTRLGGVPETDQEIDNILTSLKFKISKNDTNNLTAEIPYYRATKDIGIEDDLVEEVGRIIGYERVPESPPYILSTGSSRTKTQEAEIKIRDSLSSQGFTEVYNYTFSSDQRTKDLGYDLSNAIEVQNPVDTNLKIVQLSLVPNLLNVVSNNLKNQSLFAGFEIGRAYSKKTDTSNSKSDSEVLETRLLGCFMTGSKKEKLANAVPEVKEGEVFYSLRKAVSRLSFQLTGREVEYASFDTTKTSEVFGFKKWMHPGRAAKIILGDKVIGHIAEVRPSVLDTQTERVVIAEIDTNNLISSSTLPNSFKEFSKYPESFFEISIVMNKRVEFSTVKTFFFNELRSTNLNSIDPLSIYTGAPMKEDQKSMSLNFTFSSLDRTLSQKEVNDLRDLVMSLVEKGGYSLRS